MAINDIEEEIKETNRERKFIYWGGFAVLLVIAIFVPERYAIYPFIAAIIAILFDISRILLDIYYSNRTKSGAIISILISISRQLQEKEDDDQANQKYCPK